MPFEVILVIAIIALIWLWVCYHILQNLKELFEELFDEHNKAKEES